MGTLCVSELMVSTKSLSILMMSIPRVSADRQNRHDRFLHHQAQLEFQAVAVAQMMARALIQILKGLAFCDFQHDLVKSHPRIAEDLLDFPDDLQIIEMAVEKIDGHLEMAASAIVIGQITGHLLHEQRCHRTRKPGRLGTRDEMARSDHRAVTLSASEQALRNQPAARFGYR